MADNEKRRKIDHVSHMNLVSECSVGMINYKLYIRGKSHLNTASRMTVLNKNEDIIRKCPIVIDNLSKYCKLAKAIKNKIAMARKTLCIF